ncbi:phage portal protein [Noviherbaspirillum cavernae]|uniref:Phage portal protein n=1 Tax=Noviherbaspirillum cavernae TaxID=2320862 RepID=A0A418X1D4_9BURK|nr:phage portal protein [Noviherbaspirillum cavernae]RJG06257.1 phage portal protein [Noviherbaspirillum cavernae]
MFNFFNRGGSLRADASGGTPSKPAGWIVGLFGGGKSISGEYVTPDSAMHVMAVYASVRILAESIASLPLSLKMKEKGGKRVDADDHPLHALLHDAPNPQMTAFDFKEMKQAHMGLRGNAYSLIERDGKGEVGALYPQAPDKVTVRRNPDDGSIYYDISGGENGIPARRMLHLRGFSLDGLIGLNPIELARETVGLAIAGERAGAETVGRGIVPPAAIEVVGNPDKKQRDDIRQSWRDIHAGNRNDIAVLGAGMKLHDLRINMKDMQFMESRKFQVTEIARMFRIPPHMLADLEKATFSNIEHQDLQFLKYTLIPWIARWEQRLNLSLLSEDERSEGYFFKFNVDALMRADMKSRFEAYRTGREIGVYNANEIRDLEDRDPYEGGDIYLEPLNMQRAGAPREGQA